MCYAVSFIIYKLAGLAKGLWKGKVLHMVKKKFNLTQNHSSNISLNIIFTEDNARATPHHTQEKQQNYYNLDAAKLLFILLLSTFPPRA